MEAGETPTASLVAVAVEDNDGNTLCWEGFMSPVVDEENVDVLTVVVEGAENEGPPPPTLRIIVGGSSSKSDRNDDAKVEEWDTVETIPLAEIFPQSHVKYEGGTMSEFMDFST